MACVFRIRNNKRQTKLGEFCSNINTGHGICLIYLTILPNVSILYLISALSKKTRLSKKDKPRNRNNDVGNFNNDPDNDSCFHP